MILNWLSAADVPTVCKEVSAGAEGAAREVVARIFVLPVEDPDAARAIGRRAMAPYLTVPVYTAFHQWLGRGDMIAPVLAKWQAGDRKGALDDIPDELVDALVVHGSPEQCREHVQRYIDAGVTVPVMALLASSRDAPRLLRELAPR